jgi:hypothetical protein
MVEAWEELKEWYEKGTGKKITEGGAREALHNLEEYVLILAKWKATSQRDLNPELFETQLVDE